MTGAPMNVNPIDLMKTIPGLLPYVPYVLMALGIVAMVMPWLPLPAKERSAYGLIYAVLNALGQNYRNTRNATSPGTSES